MTDKEKAEETIKYLIMPVATSTKSYNEYLKQKEAYDHAIKVLKETRPKGEWIVTAEDSEGVHRIQCPFCGCEKGSDFVDYITVTFERMPPFCENCGARLEEKKDD